MTSRSKRINFVLNGSNKSELPQLTSSNQQQEFQNEQFDDNIRPLKSSRPITNSLQSRISQSRPLTTSQPSNPFQNSNSRSIQDLLKINGLRTNQQFILEQSRSINDEKTLQRTQTNLQTIYRPKTELGFRRSILYNDQANNFNKSKIQNSVKDYLFTYGDDILKNQNLLSSIYSLKKLELLSPKKVLILKTKALPVKSTYNDYHENRSKHGYGRNQIGNHFQK